MMEFGKATWNVAPGHTDYFKLRDLFFFFFFLIILIPLLSTVLIWTGLQAAGSTELQVHFR